MKMGAEVLTKVGEGERDSQMDLAKVVPGLTSLEMLVPQVQAASVNVVQEGTQISAHIQKVGQPYKSMDLSESEQVEKTSIYTLIMKDGRSIDQYYSAEQSLDNINSSADSNTAVSYSQDLFKILKKKKDRENSKINECAIASLPKFQHAFGRQLYQSMDGGSNPVTGSGSGNGDGSQFGTSAIRESTTRVVTEKEDSSLSKAVQTVLKETESTKIQSQQQSTQSLPAKETQEMAAQSQGVIFTCKVPISLSSSTILQGKPVAILKGGPDLIVHGKKVSDEIKKDSVIRSNMSALLAAALQTAPTIKSTANIKKQEKVEVNKDTATKVHLTSTQVQKPKRPTAVQSTGTKLMRTDNIHTGSTSQSSLVTIPLPTRTVVLAMNQPRTTSSNMNKIDRTDQTNVSSSTLEQLREFESVLEHVTNTSQMKERCVNKKSSTQDVITTTTTTTTTATIVPQSQNQQTQVSQQTVVTHQTATVVQQRQHNSTNNQQQQTVAVTATVAQPSSPKDNSTTTTSTQHAASAEFSTPVEITERVVTLVSKSGSTTVQAVQTTGSVPKMSAPVVVVQSCNSRQSSPSPTSTQKLKIGKPKTKSTSSICKTTPITPTSATTLKVSALTKPQQKPQEDEQTTQRIYAILDKYAEQLRNSPELKNKPAPRRRSNPPINPAQSSKRKKGNKKSAGCCSVDASPGGCCDDIRTLGSEDSSTEPPATPVSSVRHSDDISLPGHLQPEDVSSETCESSTDSKEVTTQTVQQATNTGLQQNVRNITQQNQQQMDKQQNVTGRTLLVQENMPHATGSVLNVEQATKVLAGKQLVVGTPTTVPLTLSLPAAANLKQVIFPVPADGRPFVVAKVPKMYRVHQVTVPGNSPLIAASTGGAVLLRQMCLNKTTVKQVKVPVQVSGIAGSSSVVLPGGSGSFTLDGDSLVLDNNTILLNTAPGATSNSGSTVTVNTTTGAATTSLLQRTATSTTATTFTNSRTTSSSTMTSQHDHVFTQDQALQTQNLNQPDIKFVNRAGEILDERAQQKPWLHVLREIKVTDEHVSLDSKEDIPTVDKGNTKDNSGKCTVESVIKVKPSFTSDKNDGTSWHSLTSTPTSAVLTVKSTTPAGRRMNSNPITASVIQDSWRKSRDLRLQKSLSEECEDLGVDKPSTSDLFPEAELLLDTDPLSRDSLHEMYSSSSRDSSPTPRYQWKKRGVTSRLIGKRQESDSSCPSTPLNGDQGEDESETGSECDWWPGTGENGRSQHGSGNTSSGGIISSITTTPITQITRKRKIGLYVTDSDDTDLDESSSEKTGGGLIKINCPPIKRECHFINGSPARIKNSTISSATTNTDLQDIVQVQHQHLQSNISTAQIGHCVTALSTVTAATQLSANNNNKITEIGQRLQKTSANILTTSIRQQINRKR